MSEDFLLKTLVILLFAFFLVIGTYCIYAVLRNKTVANPDDPNNELVPPYDKIPGLLKPVLMLLGITFLVAGLWGVCGAIFGWLWQ